YSTRLGAETRSAAARRAAMRQVNPAHVLRNYLAETAIRAAVDQGDYREIEQLRQALAQPFEPPPEFARYAAPPPDWGRGIAVSCSS
ncbi:MAG: hypothetical protein WBN82_10535, partial [Porticoccaceae bacterium]